MVVVVECPCAGPDPSNQGRSFPDCAEAGASIDASAVGRHSRACIFAFGFSSTAPDIVSAYADQSSDVPLPVICDCQVPAWVDGGTAAVLVSYSGDEPELLQVSDELRRRGSDVVCITGGGDLRDAGDIVFLLPEGLPLFSSTGLELGVLCSVVQGLGVCDARDHLVSVLPEMRRFRDSLEGCGRVTELASYAEGRIPAIYGTSDLRAAYRRWMMAVNSGCGSLAFCGELPEFDHNELVGWFDSNPHAPELRIIVLKGRTSCELLDFIIENMVDILREEGRPVETVDFAGESAMLRASCGVMMGDRVAEAIGRRG